MTNSYLFEPDQHGLYFVSVRTNNVDSGSLEFNLTYGNMYSFFHNYNIDVIDEHDKIKLINRSNNKYYITLKQPDKIIEIIFSHLKFIIIKY